MSSCFQDLKRNCSCGCQTGHATVGTWLLERGRVLTSSIDVAIQKLCAPDPPLGARQKLQDYKATSRCGMTYQEVRMYRLLHQILGIGIVLGWALLACTGKAAIGTCKLLAEAKHSRILPWQICSTTPSRTLQAVPTLQASVSQLQVRFKRSHWLRVLTVHP